MEACRAQDVKGMTKAGQNLGSDTNASQHRAKPETPDLHVSHVPVVAVLLATHNGARWIDAQLQSISEQQDVAVSLWVGDDSSTDATLERVQNWRSHLRITVLAPSPQRLGTPNRNFLRIIKDVDLGEADFVALSDQDDIWLPRKLIRATECLGAERAEAYSSDALAFWPDGRQRRLVKSSPQQPYDHLFESPGAGCTFVLTRNAFDNLREWVVAHFSSLQDVKVHDWLIYAYARTHGWKWIIDDHANLLYRQHGGNQIGANSGWQAAAARFQLLADGSYRKHVLEIAGAVSDNSVAIRAMRRAKLSDRIWLIANARRCRRRWPESLVFAIAALIMPWWRDLDPE